VRLLGFRRDLQPGQWVDLTLHFSRTAPLTLRVTAAPLGRVAT
jgi:hypothetical protein